MRRAKADLLPATKGNWFDQDDTLLLGEENVVINKATQQAQTDMVPQGFQLLQNLSVTTIVLQGRSSQEPLLVVGSASNVPVEH